MSYTADPDLQAGERVDLGLGLNWLTVDSGLKGNRFALEGLMPVYQSLDGPQMEQDWTLTLGWQYAF